MRSFYALLMNIPVSVVATTVDGTRAALAAAKPIAKQSGAPVLLLISKKPDSRGANWLVARYEEVARDVGQPVRVRVGVSSSRVAAVTTLTPTDGTIIIGGPARWWWPTEEERMAARLRRLGRRVVFVESTRGEPHA